MIPASLRPLRAPRARLLLAAGGAAALLLALRPAAPDGLGPVAARAALAVAALAAAPALLLRTRRRPADGPAPALRLIAREPLGREAGVAVIEADGRRLLVGFGPHGVRVLHAAPEREAP